MNPPTNLTRTAALRRLAEAHEATVDDTRGPVCPECNGDGESEESPLVPCPACLGSGVER